MKKNKIAAGIIVIIVLAIVFLYGGNTPGSRGSVKNTPIPTANGEEQLQAPQVSESPTKEPEKKEETKPQKTLMPSADAESENSPTAQTPTKAPAETKENKVVRDKYMTDSVPDGKPLPIEPQSATISDKKYTCTLSVKCDTILNNISWLDEEKIHIVPEDGVIFPEKEVEFYDGESVFNVLVREMKRNNIHMEFENVPVYNSAYIEGIANLYEFDCGELSGWMYKVNDWFPNYGCSRYQLKSGDKVEWVYTCDLGVDVGGYYASKGK